MQELSPRAYADLSEGAAVLASDTDGIKVFRLRDGRILKLFRRKRFPSSTWLRPYAARFERAAAGLAARNIPTVKLEAVFWVPSRRRDAVLYHPLEGALLRERVSAAPDPDAWLLKLAELMAELHAKGVYFRGIHFENVVATPTGALGLIDLSSVALFDRPLSLRRRARNFKPLVRYDVDAVRLAALGFQRFVDAYADAAQLSAADRRELVERLRAVHIAWAQGLSANAAGPAP